MLTSLGYIHRNDVKLRICVHRLCKVLISHCKSDLYSAWNSSQKVQMTTRPAVRICIWHYTCFTVCVIKWETHKRHHVPISRRKHVGASLLPVEGATINEHSYTDVRSSSTKSSSQQKTTRRAQTLSNTNYGNTQTSIGNELVTMLKGTNLRTYSGKLRALCQWPNATEIERGENVKGYIIIIVIITLFAQRKLRNKTVNWTVGQDNMAAKTRATLIVAREEKIRYTQNYTKLDENWTNTWYNKKSKNSKLFIQWINRASDVKSVSTGRLLYHISLLSWLGV